MPLPAYVMHSSGILCCKHFDQNGSSFFNRNDRDRLPITHVFRKQNESRNTNTLRISSTISFLSLLLLGLKIRDMCEQICAAKLDFLFLQDVEKNWTFINKLIQVE